MGPWLLLLQMQWVPLGTRQKKTKNQWIPGMSTGMIPDLYTYSYLSICFGIKALSETSLRFLPAILQAKYQLFSNHLPTISRPADGP